MPSADTTGALESRLLSEPTRPAVQPLETVAGKLCPTMFPASFPGSQEALLLTQEQGNEEFLKRKENHTGKTRMKGWVRWGASVIPALTTWGLRRKQTCGTSVGSVETGHEEDGDAALSVGNLRRQSQPPISDTLRGPSHHCYPALPTLVLGRG